jgi:hypothetical protein
LLLLLLLLLLLFTDRKTNTRIGRCWLSRTEDALVLRWNQTRKVQKNRRVATQQTA